MSGIDFSDGSSVVIHRSVPILSPLGKALSHFPVPAGTFLTVVGGQQTTYLNLETLEKEPGIVVFWKEQNLLGILPNNLCIREEEVHI